MYHPDQTDKLYVVPKVEGSGTGVTDAATSSTYGQGNISAVSVLKPDLDRYPLFAEARYTDAVLEPGDVLFIPSGWWHAVHSLTTSASINFNF